MSDPAGGPLEYLLAKSDDGKDPSPPVKPTARPLPAEPVADEDRRFSLAGLLAVVTICCVALAIGARLPRPMFAGLLGLLTLAALALLALAEVQWALARLSWWVLLAMYLLAVAWTIME